MTAGRWWWGLLVLAAMVAPIGAAAPSVRRRLAPDWPPLPALLADAVVTLTGVVVLAELLGTLHLFRPWPMLAGGPLAGLGLRALGRDPTSRARGRHVDDDTPAMGSALEIGIACVAVTGVLAQAFVAVGARARHGSYDFDSLHYHLTFAARFARDGATTALAYVGVGDGVAYHPANAELLHGLGLVAWRVELLTLVLNLVALGLALLAAAALGARCGRGATAVTATCAVLAVPVLGREQAGAAGNDVVAIALVLAMAALGVWAVTAPTPRRAGGLVLAGLAGGLAVGTKLTAAVPVALVALALAAAAGGLRPAVGRLVRMVPAGVLAGGYWMVRDVAHVGSPVPAAHVGIGPLRLPRPTMPLLDQLDQNVLHYLGDGAVIRDVLLPGLRLGLGPARWLLLGLAGAASLSALRGRHPRALRLLAAAGLLGLVGYLATPTSAGGLEGDPVLFHPNLRYLGPALALLAAVSATTPLARSLGAAWPMMWLTAEFMTLSEAGAWAGPHRLIPVAVGLVAVTLSLLAVAARRAGATRLLLGGACVVVLVVAGPPVARDYVRHRYADPQVPLEQMIALGREFTGGRTGISGFPLMYPYFGPRLGADVRFIAEEGPDHERREAQTCEAWRALLRAGDYDRVVILRFPHEPGKRRPAEEWTATLPGATPLLLTAAGSAYSLPDPVTDVGCQAER